MYALVRRCTGLAVRRVRRGPPLRLSAQRDRADTEPPLLELRRLPAPHLPGAPHSGPPARSAGGTALPLGVLRPRSASFRAKVLFSTLVVGAIACCSGSDRACVGPAPPAVRGGGHQLGRGGEHQSCFPSGSTPPTAPGHITGPIQLVPQVYRADLLLVSTRPGPLSCSSPRPTTPTSPRCSPTGHRERLVSRDDVARRDGSRCDRAATNTRSSRSPSSPDVGVHPLPGRPACRAQGTGSPAHRGCRRNHPPARSVVHQVPPANVVPAGAPLYCALFAAVLLGVTLDRLRVAVRDGRLAATLGARWGREATAAALGGVLTALALFHHPTSPTRTSGPSPNRPTSRRRRSGRASPRDRRPSSTPPPSGPPSKPSPGSCGALASRCPSAPFWSREGTSGPIAFDPTVGYTVDTPLTRALDSLYSGTPPPMTPAEREVLRDQLLAWHLKSIIAFPQGARPQEVVPYFIWAYRRRPPRGVRCLRLVPPGRRALLWGHAVTLGPVTGTPQSTGHPVGRSRDRSARCRRNLRCGARLLVSESDRPARRVSGLPRERGDGGARHLGSPVVRHSSRCYLGGLRVTRS